MFVNCGSNSVYVASTELLLILILRPYEYVHYSYMENIFLYSNIFLFLYVPMVKETANVIKLRILIILDFQVGSM